LKEIIDATKPGKSCVQNIRNYMQYIKEYSEDCLVLNIWSPNSDNKSSDLKAVMFWIHGGGLTAGSIYQTEFNGSVLAAHDVVMVAANYRLGFLGFMYGGIDSSPGNLGLYDQLLALKWV
jgi:carboxylesterase type B